jgi:predicted AlkP superfamily phosphohydrolase/phosphomutase
MTRVIVYGIDGVSPDLLFEKWQDDLPNIKKLMQEGCYARLNSTIPPVTIIAWSAFASGKDASEIGAFSYTYQDRKTGKNKLISSDNVKADRIWDILGKHNKKSIVLNVPLTYPAKPINGIMVSDFLTPSIESDCTFPAEIKERIKKLGSTEYFFDVAGVASHKGLDAEELIKRTYQMTDMQLSLLKDMIKNERWDFLMQVFIGTDRLQHMLWRHFDSTHREFIKDSKFKDELKNYYKYLDKHLGEILSMIDDDTVVIVSSDHGMIKQEGKININNWLMEKGYLSLTPEFSEEIKKKITRQNFEGIDMENTIAYGSGASHARIFFNKEKIKKEKLDYDDVREKMIKELMKITDDKGKKIKTEIFKAEDIYAFPDAEGCPDLTVYFDELRWASNPDFGMKGLYSWESAVGADNAVHSKQGSFLIAGPGIAKKGYISEISIYQATPTILKIMGVKIPKGIKHKAMDVFDDHQ